MITWRKKSKDCVLVSHFIFPNIIFRFADKMSQVLLEDEDEVLGFQEKIWALQLTETSVPKKMGRSDKLFTIARRKPSFW